MTDLHELSEGLYLEDYIKAQEKQLQSKIENEGLLLSYKKVLKDPDGKRVLWDILQMCRVFHLSMTGNSWTYFNEGSRQIGLYIMTMIKVGNSISDIEDGFKKVRPDG